LKKKALGFKSLTLGTRWIIGLAFQIISIILSAKSTFSPIIEHKILRSLQKGRPVGVLNYIFQLLQVIAHLLFATGVLYLIKVNHRNIFYIIACLGGYELMRYLPAVVLSGNIDIYLTYMVQILKRCSK